MKLRWLHANWPISMYALADKMKANAFSPESQSGFLLERVRSNKIVGRFVERIEISDSVENPLGGASIFERIEYKQIRFSIQNEEIGIELIDPPRGLSSLINAVSHLCSYEVPIFEAKTDVVAWSENFERLSRVSLFAKQARITGVKIEDSVSASATLRGGCDVRKAATDYFGDGITFSRIELATSGPNVLTLALSNNAAATLIGPSVDPYVDVLRAAMLLSLQGT